MKTIAKALRAGTQTGSLINHVISGAVMASPEVGMDCTILCWTDRHAATIVEISPNGKRIGIVQDVATPKFKGMTECQDYDYAPGIGDPQYYTLRKNGAWVREGESLKGQRIAIGNRDEYHDFSF